VTPVGGIGQETDRRAGCAGQRPNGVNQPAAIAADLAMKPFREFSQRRGASVRRVGLIRCGIYSAAPGSSEARSASSLRSTSSVISTALP
jgi:hypothetical protein